MTDISKSAATINAANTNQMGAALIVQTYANSVIVQPKVDFTGIAGLSSFETQINDGLATAQGHANYYLDTLQPTLIQNMSNIGNYYQLNKVLPIVLPPGSTVKQWIQELQQVLSMSTGYQADAKKIVADLSSFHGQLATDAQSFATTVTNLNSAVSGDNGVLASIDSELGSIQKNIDGAIAGIVISSLTVVGGVFVICVGAIADFVTAGTSTGAVIGGVGLVAAGVAGEAGSITALVSLNNQKAGLLSEESRLQEEVKLATAVSSGYSSLVNQVDGALNAASAMANAWNSLSSDLGNLITDLQNSLMTPDQVNTLFVAAANGEISTVLADIQTIKGQLAGVTVQVAQKGETVSDVITKVAQAA